MHEQHLADTLADVRAMLATLGDREASLRDSILAVNGPVPEGLRTRIEVVTGRARYFDVDLLPGRIRTDPGFWRTRTVRYIRCLPLGPGMVDPMSSCR